MQKYKHIQTYLKLVLQTPECTEPSKHLLAAQNLQWKMLEKGVKYAQSLQ